MAFGRAPSARRQLAGMRAKRMGETWEHVFESAAWRAGCKVIGLPDGCKIVGGGKLVRVKVPFDFVLVKGGRSVFLDTKTTLSDSWTYSMNDPQQIHWLSQCAAGGCRAGYVVEFRKHKKVVFFSVELLAGLTARQSLKPGDGILISGDEDRLDLGRLFYERLEEKSEA